MAFSDHFYVVFKAFGDYVKVRARPPAFLENQLPHLVEARIDLVEAPIDISELGIDFVESPIDISESGIDFVEARIDISEPGIDFVEARIDISESDIDLVEAPVEIVKSPFQILVVHVGAKSSARASRIAAKSPESALVCVRGGIFYTAEGQ